MPDPRGYLLPEERRILLRRYAPVMVLFPELPRQAPYPDEGDAVYTMRGSYHPRAAEFFLKYAKVRYRRSLWLRHPMLLFKPHSYVEERERAKQAITAEELRDAVTEHRSDPRYTGLGDADLRAAVLLRLTQRRLTDRIRGFDLPKFRGNNLKHWKQYYELLNKTEPVTKRSVIYGRFVQGLAPLGEQQAAPQSTMVQISHLGPYDVNQTRVALQYWFPYYYDDWANRHEGDWESITILLDLGPEIITLGRELTEDELLAGVKGADVGYASHEDGYRRLWDDVQKTSEGRPIVYVARGSSASYFSWQLDGIPTSARVGVVEKLLAAVGSLVRGKRFLGRRWDAEFRARFTGRDPKNTDWTPADPEPEDRLNNTSSNPLERFVPMPCRGVRRFPTFGPDAGLDGRTYHLEMADLFWLEMVEELGVQWGEDFFMPGTKGPSGMSKADRDKKRRAINSLARVETHIQNALTQLIETDIDPSKAIPELDRALRPLRPPELEKQNCFPESIRTYVYIMWTAVLRTHPEAWPGGPGLYLRWIFARQPKPGPLLEREDPIYHLKSLLALVRRTRYEVQHEGSKWDNPFAWARQICLADTFYYGIGPAPILDAMEVISRMDCKDTDMSAV
jgi:hypothetical protein